MTLWWQTSQSCIRSFSTIWLPSCGDFLCENIQIMTKSVISYCLPLISLHKRMTQHRRASSSGQDSAFHLNLKGQETFIWIQQCPHFPEIFVIVWLALCFLLWMQVGKQHGGKTNKHGGEWTWPNRRRTPSHLYFEDKMRSSHHKKMLLVLHGGGLGIKPPVRTMYFAIYTTEQSTQLTPLTFNHLFMPNCIRESPWKCSWELSTKTKLKMHLPATKESWRWKAITATDATLIKKRHGPILQGEEKVE